MNIGIVLNSGCSDYKEVKETLEALGFADNDQSRWIYEGHDKDEAVRALLFLRHFDNVHYSGDPIPEGMTVQKRLGEYQFVTDCNIHPGEILSKEFLMPMNISQYQLAKDLNIPETKVSEIIKGQQHITEDTALRLSKYFGNSARFWLSLQAEYDLELTKKELRKRLGFL